MKVFIMRHGEAVHYAATDEERELTPHGVEASLSVATACNNKGFAEFDKVLVSPYVRAQQTWQAVKSQFASDSVEVCDDITPYGQSEDVVEFVCALADVENLQSILLISHLPLVGYLTADFIGDSHAPMFPTSGLVCIDFDLSSRKGEMLWNLRP
ncbi:phosphohistidine phosphatase SixA [Vibrio hippocampi]|uniref:Phosphohistidine phosphatase SixA n=1 Tax=Vibrio hippocampi TaxID=654686 RepID=A0ABN8DJE0_9VIBR|nr:phosphohistidine phosphatase SixA [Vibrio hippocampi]CAH0525258.1 Phosphohistidine phosphatase SixA [Vibrio hippocampi]